MKATVLKGKWNELKGAMKKKWGKLSEDDLKQVEGSKDKLVGKIQEKYGKSKEQAEREVEEWHEENK
ncbi:CsbD-like protein [Anaerohalosphaera lusitana]|uniref:CsbD-like protein n=1 Tax=Anaerohalosphaera lusitana TaxID=1936003 RepID=A0A1U9NIF4_9BACT|nr:CsbD family protein [Anaerohalosphaera lusitana]AQT67514.1 CsbD-like protein [Anaerohalosphaera lusitana]